MKRSILLILTLSVVINIYSQSAKDYFDTATKNWSSDGDLKKSILNLNKAIEINPMYAQAYYWRGVNKVAEAKKINSYVWKNGNSQVDGDSIRKQDGLHRSAIEDFSKAIEIDKKEPYYYISRGDEELWIEDNYSALSDFRKAVEFASKDDEISDYYDKCGQAEVGLKYFNYAIEDFTKAIELYKNPYRDTSDKMFSRYKEFYGDLFINRNDINAGFYLDRARAKRELKDYSGAIHDYNVLIDFDEKPENISKNENGEFYESTYETTLREKAECNIEMKDYFSAIQVYNKIINSKFSRYSTPGYYFKRGHAKLLLEDFRGAIEDASRAILLDSTSTYSAPQNYWLRGTAEYDLKKYRDAIQDFNKAIKLDSNDLDSYRNRGFAKIESGDKNGGCLDLSKAGELGDKDAYKWIKEYCQ